ncbi:MAG: 4Fe-4S dicluster domain-containing protein [Muribaculaceae bacterium]|nr:4Fe-4S dicluster domain-containing protein [Muribaculaceae bacterium]
MNRYRPIRYGRIAVQVLVVAAITAALILGVPCLLSRMQIIPAIVSCATLWLIVWGVATLIFGRIYCSTICPCGATIDFFTKNLRKRKSRFTYSLPSNRLRYSIFVIVVLCALLGFSVALALLDPYSAFARIVNACARPLAVGVAGLIVAALTLGLIILFSARRGRIICNTVCPVGTLLGTVSRVSLYHPDINTDLCINCRKCVDVCSAQCINLTDHVVDSSRCVVCFHCMDVCPNAAITYRRGRHQLSIPLMQRTVSSGAGVSAAAPTKQESPSMTPIDRRKFLITGALAASSAIAAVAKHNPSYVKGAVPLVPLNYVTPPGTSSREDFLRRCTACGACVSACPTEVITPSTKQFGVRHALTPVMDFDKAYCSFDCVRCSEVCPTKALRPLTPNEKHHTAIGRARICADNCRLYVNGIHCGICAKVCPKRAISIVTDSEGRKFPQLEPELCIGCGRCSYACPSKPYRAIVIEGQ